VEIVNKTKRLAYNSLIYSIGTFLPVLVNFILIPLYTRYLSTDDYGIMSIADIITKITTILLAMGLPVTIVRFYYDFKDNPYSAKKYLGAIISFVVLIGLTVSGILTIWGEGLFKYFLSEKSALFNPYIIMAIWTSFFALTSSIIANWYQAKSMPWYHVIITSINFLTLTSLMVYFVVLQNGGALGAIKAGLVSSIFVFIIMIPIIIKESRLNLSLKRIAPSLKFSLPLIPVSLASWLLIFIDRILLERYTNLSQVGIYSLGYSAGMVMMLIVASIHKAWAPFFFTRLKNGFGVKLFGEITTYYIALVSLIGLFGSLFSKELIMLLTTPDYYNAYTLVPLVILGYIFYGFYNVVTTPLFYKKKTNLILIYTLISVIVNIGLNIWWIPLFGMIGAAYATAVSYFVLFILGIVSSQKNMKVPYQYSKMLGILAITGTIYICILQLFDDSILIKSLGIIVYILALYIFGIINKNDISKIYKTLNRHENN